jgi:diguanylate cyclase (GGDEF)-like protein/PAS domain S-box-containing protein
MQRSNETLQAMFSAMSEGVVCQRPDGTLIDCNPAAERILGLKREVLLGRSSMDPRWRAVHEDGSDFPGDSHPSIVCLRTGHPIRDQIMGIHDPLRGLRWLSINADPVFEGSAIHPTSVVTTFVDITERLRVQSALDVKSQEILDLYENAPCGYHSVDKHGKFIHINATELSWLGCTLEEALSGLGPIDFFTEESKAKFHTNFPKLLANGQINEIELDLVGRQGQLRHVSVNATIVRDMEGNFQFTRSVMFDITQLHLARQIIDRTNREQLALLDNDLIGMARTRNRKTIWKNRAFDRLFGYETSEVIGQTSRLVYKDDATFERIGLQAYPVLAAGGHFRTQVEMLRKDGSGIWVDLSGAMTSEENQELLWMFMDITDSKNSQRKIEHVALHDVLTDLPNRSLLMERLARGIAVAKREPRRIAVMFLDLDRFKEVNDTFGHAAGDELLIVIANKLQALVRVTDTVARLGGDEFVIKLDNPENIDEVVRIADRVVSVIAERVAIQGHLIQVGASIGISMFPENGTSSDELVANADAAMYFAKRAGKKRYHFAPIAVKSERS